MASTFRRLLSIPPFATVSVKAKPTGASLKKLAVAVSPTFKAVSEIKIDTVGALVSTAKLLLVAAAPELPAAPVKLAAVTLILASAIWIPAVGVNSAV